MEQYVEKETKNGYTLKIYVDEYPQNPREWDNLGTMVCFHKQYNLGDKHKYSDPQDAILSIWQEHGTQEEKREYILETCKGNIQRYRSVILDAYSYKLDDLFDSCADNFGVPEHLPYSMYCLSLYLYDHGGITMNTSGFSCPWDSGQVGFIYVTKEMLEKEGLSNKTDDEIYDYLKGEVATYDQYIRGDVYGFVVEDSDGEHLDSCWGFFGDEHALAEGRDILNHYAEKQVELGI